MSFISYILDMIGWVMDGWIEEFLVVFFSLIKLSGDSFSLFPLVRWILSLALKVLYQESKAKGLLEFSFQSTISGIKGKRIARV